MVICFAVSKMELNTNTTIEGGEEEGRGDTCKS
jgi:hypothetical protein